MPLRAGVVHTPFLGLPDNIDASTELFFVRFTGEVFADYRYNGRLYTAWLRVAVSDL